MVGLGGGAQVSCPFTQPFGSGGREGGGAGGGGLRLAVHSRNHSVQGAEKVAGPGGGSG